MPNFIKRFTEWLSFKSSLDGKKHKPPLFNEREVWWCFVGENVGVEISGKGKRFRRPVLILKKLDPRSFIGVPLSTTKRAGNWFCQIIFNDKQNTVILAQIRHYDYRRLAGILGTLPKDDVDLIKFYFYDLLYK